VSGLLPVMVTTRTDVMICGHHYPWKIMQIAGAGANEIENAGRALPFK
jgi:hypothetical protein